jgi:hypothetical protein
MTKPSSENHGRAQKLPSTEYPTDATIPEHVPGTPHPRRESADRHEQNERGRSREEPRNQHGDRPTPQPPLGGERADNGSD